MTRVSIRQTARGDYAVAWRNRRRWRVYVPTRTAAGTLRDAIRAGTDLPPVLALIYAPRGSLSFSALGKASAAALTPEQRSDRARKAAVSRWAVRTPTPDPSLSPKDTSTHDTRQEVKRP